MDTKYLDHQLLDPLFRHLPIMDTKYLDHQLLDPLFRHLARDCSARDIVSLKCASKTWAQMVSESIKIIALSRWEDDNKDWYFPLRFERDRSKSAGADGWNSFIWSGVHHASGEIHRLPPLPPFNATRMLLTTQYYDHRLGRLLASAGGLLLFADKMVSLTSPSHSFVVLNPLTKQWRPLPALNVLRLYLRKNGNIEAHMVVDEKANSYKVILRYLHFASVYSSTSDSWRNRAPSEIIEFEYQPPLGLTPQAQIDPRAYWEVPCALAAGKLYYAQLDVEGSEMLTVMRTHDPSGDVIRVQGSIRLSEFEYEAGKQKPPVRHYALRTYFLLEMPDEWYGFGIHSFQVKIVGCMNGLYAILPALLDLERAVDVDIMRADGAPDLDRGQTYGAYGCLPLQFYVLRLSGTGMACGRLIIRLPSTLSEEENEEDKKLRQKCSRISRWYWCSARGRVIWLLWDDYLVDYDVVTGKSTTRILPDKWFGPEHEHQPALDFRASFHMMP